MTKTGKIITFAFYSVCALALMTTTAAAAYIDPATTSYVIQIVAGVVIACGTAFGIIFNKMRRKLRKKSESGEVVQNLRTDNAEGSVIKADDLLDDNK